MLKKLAVALLVAASVPALQSCAHRATQESAAATPAAAALERMYAAEWDYLMREFPEWATSVGVTGYNDRWTDNSFAAIEARKAHARELLARAEAASTAGLSPADRLNHELFLYNAQRAVAGDRFPSELMPINQLGGVHQEVADMMAQAPRQTVKDVEDMIARLRGVPAMVDQAIALMRRGAETGVTPPRITLANVSGLIANQIVEDPEQSPIYNAGFAAMVDSIPATEQARLKAEAKAAISEDVVPAYRRLKEFWDTEYYHKTRTTIACSDLPDGPAWYAHQVASQTTTDMTPEEIHALGLSEVARIRAAMEAIKAEVKFQGTLREFFDFLRTDPQFFYTTREDLLAGYREISKRIDPELPRLFGRLPRLPYGVIAVPSYSEKTQTTAYYNSGSLAAGRPGYFYANTYDLKSRPKWEMEALTLHEAVPGHHLQIAIAQEMDDLPDFRRHGHFTAYVEGWGLYAESLGPELGRFKDPYSRFGALTYEMWRAIRLVVDTGMHAKGWSREQAIDYFLDNAGKARHDVEVEVDRYIVWPGQALAYKIGQLKLLALKKEAQTTLGEKFNIRQFHDVILESGAVPLTVLEERVRAWVKGQG